PQGKQCGDQSIAPKKGAEPGNAGENIGSVRRARCEHPYIGLCPPSDLVEDVVRTFDYGTAGFAGSVLTAQSNKRTQIKFARTLGRTVSTGKRHEDDPVLARVTVDREKST